jgi:hypothetical protein
MSIDDNNSLKSNIFDDDIKLSPIHNEDDENSNSSFSLSQKYSPLFINNENFINYFMHIDYNTPFQNNIKEDLKEISNPNLLKVESQSQNEVKTLNESNKKLKKENKKEFGILFDSKTGISYNEEEDPVNYRKAKKRIQNRESALRMKKMREGLNSKIEEELFHLREDNIRLINENVSLKKEKEFLIDQIKFMQKIIKESNLEFKLKNEHSFDSTDNNANTNNNSSSEENSTKKVFYYDGSKQKIKGNLFNVFIICTLSVLYIVGECGFNIDKADNNNGQNTNLRSGNSIKLNSIKETISNKHSFWFYFSKMILLLIFILIIPSIKQAGKIFKDFIKRYRIRNYFIRNKEY